MNKSKLPKPSGLRPPSKVTPGSSQASAPNMLRRRSKSYSDLSTVAKITKPFRPVLKPLQTVHENETPVENDKLRRRSKSNTDLNRVNLKKPLTSKPKPVATVRAPVKRPATDKVPTESKPKVPKQNKLPDWDYKGRFNQLNEKYQSLQENNKSMRDKLSGFTEIENNYEKVQHELENLHAEKISLFKCKKALTAENAELKSENKKIHEELTSLREKHEQLSNSHEDLLEKHKCNTKSIETLTAAKNSLEEQLSVLTQKYEELNKAHEILSEQKRCSSKENAKLISHNNSLTTALEQEKQTNTTLRKEIEKIKEDLQKSDIIRRHLHNTVQDLKGNIRVFCRIRPPKSAEEEEQLQCSINYVDDNCMEIRKSKESVSISGKPADIKVEYKFDKIFPPESTQAQVFEELAQLVQSALDGYNVCVFAYGQTGSGKTYTMQGDTDDPSLFGMIPRTIDLIFERINTLQRAGWTYEVKASFLEIYNENIRDLLDPKSTKSFDIRFNEGKGTSVTNLTIQSIKSATELKKYMSLSHRNRAVAATDFNEHSSRSHAVTKIYLDCFHNESNGRYSGSINLVDLAGSESAKTSSMERLTETKSINKSLSTLGKVILALFNKDNHIPYRDSKLTYLLQSCLGGNSKTLMFVNISPFEECYFESINSLRFASNVKEVKLSSKRNRTNNNAVTNK